MAPDEAVPEKQPMCSPKNDCLETWRMIVGSKVNLLLVFVPFGVISHYIGWSASVTFFLNFLGMIPLASILGDATEVLAEHLGETIGGLLNATFGNAVEVVVMVMALVKAKNDEEQRDTLLDVVQTSLIGSIFSNSLLVLGCAFVANGFIVKESKFNVTVNSANVSLLMISAFVMLLPGAYTGNSDKTDILMVSRAAAIILMLMYICLLVFVLGTHAHLIEPEADKAVMAPASVQLQSSIASVKQASEDDEDLHTDSDFQDVGGSGGSTQQTLKEFQSHKSGLADVEEEPLDGPGDADGEDENHLTMAGSMVVLLVATILVAVLSEYLVDSIDPMAKALDIAPAFVGIILLPIIGNAVEHITAIRMALVNKMDISLSIAIGSATQVAMFVVALAVIVGWILDIPLSLAFDPFQIQLFIYSSIIIFATISDGSSNWLEGVMLLGLYVLVAIAVWHQCYCSGISQIDFGGSCVDEDGVCLTNA